MVGPLMLLKMLHCKQFVKKKSNLKHNSSGESTSHCCSEDMKEFKVNVKVEQPDDCICRVCLKEGDTHIYKDAANDVPDALNLFAGIDVDIEDTYPKFLCQSCLALLQGAIVLRNTAQKSDSILKQTIAQESFSQNENDDSEDYEEDIFLSELRKPKKEKVDTQKYYFCKRCNMEFKSCEDYTNHKLSGEHDNLRHVCPICKNSYAALYFKRHMALHNKQDMETYMCDICGKKFTVKGQFTRHRLTHFYKLPYKCSLCPYKGRFNESLKMHMRTHTGEKPYQCTQCASRFINKSNLNKHMLIHKGEHDFKCDACGRGFYTKRELDQHFKVDHTGIKDHVCNVCGKAFGYRKAMMKHQLKVHKREKLKSGRMPLYLKVETMKSKGEKVIVES
ncbi:hypothetical protein K1T71_013555 [Dendrolimus kikuchii]|uniref:Uncharacterized protein n=1 Tax=Dendrolimus kikuchii TaxID=765133 RepID=A0ACC1CGR6_9NEOP|nr:hypothetical protein K1T71_013555 [Dendrolimus kikuchii]